MKKKTAAPAPKNKRPVVTIGSEDLEKAIASLGTFLPFSPDETTHKILTAVRDGVKIRLVNDISVELQKYATLPLECDGLTRVLSYVLAQQKVKHTIMIGHFEHKGMKIVPVHWWIVLKDGRIVDYRARMWAGNNSDIPHGVFNATSFPDMKYLGKPQEIEISKKTFDILTTLPPAPKLIEPMTQKPAAVAT